ncbi:hypothetical protein BC749_11118 [Flavobacterium araucananum]|uniref:Uncharacterized protein n=1 Tax=Flavobacterium araucananum TaxID=946678 RepID=A0A227PIF2_9FLAO|nr:hypothetical protein [Flavobacterium araucananum]OXG09649.1 hypothetical protein B0A64_00015 [Flavobacterium araucananum]PWJ96029.1 hypothetical protein BC749_11118 [Flavobacterium araucananum]
MEINFDVIRIGKIRKDNTAEIILKQNVNFMKCGIRHLLNNIDNLDEKIEIILAIPGKGYSVKIVLQEVKKKHIRNELKNNFPYSIYNGKYSAILDNVNNKISKGY